MKIEKGKRYLRTFYSSPFFTIGKIYQSTDDDYLIDDSGVEHRVMVTSPRFQLVEEPSTEELLKRIEALEKISKEEKALRICSAIIDMAKDIHKTFDEKKPCPTAAKFKEIADHANAINDIVKNAPDDTVYVPDGILSLGGGIINGNNVLGYSKSGWHALSISNPRPSTHQQFKLVKCEREELKAGDVAFRSRLSKPDFLEKSKYCIILEAGSYQFWRGKNCINDTMHWNHWYKVVGV